MRSVIRNIIEKTIEPKFGPLTFHVVHGNDIRPTQSKRIGYLVTYYMDDKPDKETAKDIIKETGTILGMLGLQHIKGSHSGNYIFVDGLEP